MLSAYSSWTLTALSASAAVATAATGFVINAFAPGSAPMVSTGLLVAAVGCTATAFGLVAARLRRIELENMGLIEEISQEFDRVKDKLEIFSEALAEPRTIQPEVVESEAPTTRRVTVK